MSLVRASSHPLVAHHLAALRNKDTPPPEFRRLVRRLTFLLVHEATESLPTRGQSVSTPLGPAPAHVLADWVAIVPILRAGLGMAEAALELIPEAEVWHVGLFRDEATLAPTEYYNKLPTHSRATVALLVDPMLATGGSAVHGCALLRKAGIDRLIYVGLIAAPEGVDALADAFPDVPIHIGAIDEKLNDVGFIHPGLGDAGDRQFNTAHESMR